MDTLAKHWSELLTCFTTLVAAAGWWHQRTQTNTARSALAVAERATLAAERQVSLAEVEAQRAATSEVDAQHRAQAAESRANLAHERMKAQLAPSLKLMRRANQWDLHDDYLRNDGSGDAHDLSWDYSYSPVMSDDALDLVPIRHQAFAIDANQHHHFTE
jgi:hypothetical protein